MKWDLEAMRTNPAETTYLNFSCNGSSSRTFHDQQQVYLSNNYLVGVPRAWQTHGKVKEISDLQNVQERPHESR